MRGRPPGPQSAYAKRLGISREQVLLLGGVEYLQSLDPLIRQVLINSLSWKVGRPRMERRVKVAGANRKERREQRMKDGRCSECGKAKEQERIGNLMCEACALHVNWLEKLRKCDLPRPVSSVTYEAERARA